MRRRVLLTALGVTWVAGTPARAALPLTAWRWKSRLLLIFAPSDDDPSYMAQIRELAAHDGEERERDLVRIVVIGLHATIPASSASPDAKTLRAAYGVPAEQFETILIGKDGGVKLRQSSPIAASRLFGVIDRMPMRRSEARLR